MTNENFLRGALLFLAALGMTFAIMAMSPAMAEEDRDQVVRKALINRTNTFCKAVLPAWFASERGIAEPEVKAVVADCYMGHARLTILGMENGLSLGEIALSEVPAALLRRETGMNLDIYRPLAGRTIRIRAKEQ